MNKDFWLKTIAARETLTGYGYPVNCKYWPQLKDCPILRKLIKKGIVVRERISYGSAKSKKTFLRVAKNET